MNLRKASIFAALLAAGFLALWIETKRPTPPPPAASTPESQPLTAPSTTPAITTPSAPNPPPAKDPAPPDARPTPPPPPASITSAVTPGMPMVRTTTPPVQQPQAPVAAPPQNARPAPQLEGRVELERIHSMLRDFRTRMGENPVGSNAEIMRAVTGDNPAGARLGPPEGQELNEQGELVDRWGTPYFFHQLSKTPMEVRSAGPDRRMWTADDLVSK